jgi:hypothetical protein
MKQIYLSIAVILACNIATAQYKKASFLNKAGRTYDVGFTGHFLSGGGGTMPGIYYSYGRDKNKRAFHWFDIEVLLPTKFQYTTYDKNNPEAPVTVKGKSKIGFAYRYNFAYYLINAETSGSKIKPFVTAGVNILAIGGGGTIDGYDYPPNTDPEKIIDANPVSFGANAGLGAIYSFSEKIGIKLTAGYNLQAQMSPGNFNESSSVYKVFSNHPYAGIGVRFVMTGND